MRFPLRINLMTRVLGTACAVMTAIVTGLSLFPAELPDIAQTGQKSPVVPEIVVPATYVPPAFESFAEVLERPLLFEDRRLPEAATESVKPAPREPLRLALEGVALTSTSRIALVRDQNNSALVQVAEGMMHNGWTLERIDSDRAIFVRDGETTELLLEPKHGNGRR